MTSPAAGPVADSVRLAWPTEAGAIADLQRRSWAESPGAVGERLLASIGADEMAQAWHQVISRPPQAQHRVLVAVAEARIVGFASTVPSADADAEAGRDAEIAEFVVDPPARHLGHGSRLLNACADTLRADGFHRAVWWVLATDDAMRRFLTVAGWAPDGAHREIGTEDDAIRVKQIRLHTDLSPG